MTLRDRYRRTFSPIPDNDDSRYLKVKRSMAAIKCVLHERKQITQLIKAEEEAKNASQGDKQGALTTTTSSVKGVSDEEPRLP